jgi:hypothetical protein
VLAKSDPALAYVALYDAARKAITGHMQAHGYRVTNRPGAHQAVGLYADAALSGGAVTLTFGPSIGCARSATAANTTGNRSPSNF